MGTGIVNRIIQNWQDFDSKEKSNTAPVPRLLMLEVTNVCNLKCKMCGNKDMTRANGRMSVELGKKAIRDAAKMGISEIAFFSTGEPLIYPHLEELIFEAKANNLYCFLTSNGMLLKESVAEMLCNSGLDSFKCSIDGTNKKEYESIRKGGNFDVLMKNLSFLRKKRDELDSKLKIICGMVLINENKANISAFKEQFAPIADDILISNASNMGGKNKEIIENNSLDFAQPKPCKLLWDRIVVNYDGKITACCIDFDAELVYGNYINDSLENIWNNPLIQNWRGAHLSGNIKSVPMCNQCDAPYVFESDKLMEVQKADEK